jgi:hypothetical protein
MKKIKIPPQLLLTVNSSAEIDSDFVPRAQTRTAVIPQSINIKF